MSAAFCADIDILLQKNLLRVDLREKVLNEYLKESCHFGWRVALICTENTKISKCLS